MRPVWIFRRGAELLRLERDRDETRRLVLRAIDARGTREHLFDDLNDLIATQDAVERHLVNGGWTLVEFRNPPAAGRDGALE